MKKSILILLICATLTACGNQETQTAITKNVATETSTQVQSETTTETALTSETATTTVVTTETKITSTNTSTTTEITSSEKKNAVTTKVTSAETTKSTPITTTQLKPTTTASMTKSTTTTTTTTVPKTTIITTTEVIPPQTEPTQNNLTDYEKALEIYEYMRTNGSGTCVQYSYQTYEMCVEYGLECYFVRTENKLYGHVANVVKLDGVWYVMDTQAGCFLTENMCGFTEIVDANENYIASADVISSTRYV